MNKAMFGLGFILVMITTFMLLTNTAFGEETITMDYKKDYKTIMYTVIEFGDGPLKLLKTTSNFANGLYSEVRIYQIDDDLFIQNSFEYYVSTGEIRGLFYNYFNANEVKIWISGTHQFVKEQQLYVKDIPEEVMSLTVQTYK